MSDKPFKFEIVDAAELDGEKDWSGFIVYRVRVSNGERLEIFRSSTGAEASAWLKRYLALPVPERRKMREAST